MTTRHDNSIQRLKTHLVALLHHQGGVSAVEFSLFAPLFIIGLVVTADIGFAISQRMAMDHILRAGAQSAMSDPNTTNVWNTLEITASENFNVGSSSPSGGKPSLTLSVERYCVCPDNPAAKVACSTICPGSVPTRAYYALSASRTYSGMIIPAITFKPEIQVQVR